MPEILVFPVCLLVSDESNVNTINAFLASNDLIHCKTPTYVITCFKLNYNNRHYISETAFGNMQSFQLGTSRSHFFVPESNSESFDFEYLPIPSPDLILWQCINAVPSNLHILLQVLDFHLQINLDIFQT